MPTTSVFFSSVSVGGINFTEQIKSMNWEQSMKEDDKLTLEMTSPMNPADNSVRNDTLIPKLSRVMKGMGVAFSLRYKQRLYGGPRGYILDGVSYSHSKAGGVTARLSFLDKGSNIKKTESLQAYKTIEDADEEVEGAPVAEIVNLIADFHGLSVSYTNGISEEQAQVKIDNFYQAGLTDHAALNYVVQFISEGKAIWYVRNNILFISRRNYEGESQRTYNSNFLRGSFVSFNANMQSVYLPPAANNSSNVGEDGESEVKDATNDPSLAEEPLVADKDFSVELERSGDRIGTTFIPEGGGPSPEGGETSSSIAPTNRQKFREEGRYEKEALIGPPEGSPSDAAELLRVAQRGSVKFSAEKKSEATSQAQKSLNDARASAVSANLSLEGTFRHTPNEVITISGEPKMFSGNWLIEKVKIDATTRGGVKTSLSLIKNVPASDAQVDGSTEGQNKSKGQPDVSGDTESGEDQDFEVEIERSNDRVGTTFIPTDPDTANIAP